MTMPSKNQKAWAEYLRDQIRDDVCVTKYYDEDESHSIAVFFSKQNGGVVASNIGLMDWDQSCRPAMSIPCEVLMDDREDTPEIGNIISTMAFYVMKDGWKLSPGAVFEDLISMYLRSPKLPHLYFTTPFQWGKEMVRVNLSETTIFPLLAVPISDAESIFVKQSGGEELESLWEAHGVDVLDWKRSSVA